MMGGILGISVYGLVNHWLIRDWSPAMTVLEVVWGPMIGAFAGAFIAWAGTPEGVLTGIAMKIRSGRLTGKAYYYAFLAGAKKILENQKELNRINVFPVPDADTGSNLASTVRAIIERVRPHRSYKVTSAAIAAAALEGARGNSGVIFAQFLHGLGAESCGSHEISVAHFGQSVRAAVRTMYEAIAEPKEGTMITVIRKWAESVASPKEESESFLKVLTRAQVRAVEALQETRYRLEAMRRAKVVDAGSKGMVLFLEGMIDFLAKPSHKKLLSIRREAAGIERVAEVPSEPGRRRYCTEALIKPLPGREGPGLDRDGAEERDLGVRRFARHRRFARTPSGSTSTPTRPRSCSTRSGTSAPSSRRRPTTCSGSTRPPIDRKRPIALVTDSACDLPAGGPRPLSDPRRSPAAELRRQPVPRQGDHHAGPVLPDARRAAGIPQDGPAQPAGLREPVREPGRPLRFDHLRSTCPRS